MCQRRFARENYSFYTNCKPYRTNTILCKKGKKALEEAGMIVEEVEITQLPKEEISSILHKCDYIYITGGNTFFLLQELKRKGVDKIISKQVKLGKLYIGESAGAIIASPDAEYMRSVNFDPIEKAPELKDCTSLDLVDFYTIPHYGNFPFKKKVKDSSTI